MAGGCDRCQGSIYEAPPPDMPSLLVLKLLSIPIRRCARRRYSWHQIGNTTVTNVNAELSFAHEVLTLSQKPTTSVGANIVCRTVLSGLCQVAARLDLLFVSIVRDNARQHYCVMHSVDLTSPVLAMPMFCAILCRNVSAEESESNR